MYETIADDSKLRGVSLDSSNHPSFWSLPDYDRICLSPSSLEKLLNALELEQLDIWVGGFDGRAPYARPRCSGRCSDFSGLAASLISPSLCWVAFIDTVSHSLEHSELSALFQAISSPHFSQSLSTLRVNVSCSASPGERLAEIGDSVATTATATFTTVFKPCLSLSQLTSLQFLTSASDDGVWLPVTDDDLRAVAKAMPKLQSLTLLCFSPPNRSRSSPLTCPTLLGILHLAERCPELTELILSAIDFSLVDIPIPPSLVSGGHHLTRLLLAACLWLSDEVPEVEEPLALAGLLTRVFPKLEQRLTVRFPARRWEGPLEDIVKALVDPPESYNADGQRPPRGVSSY